MQHETDALDRESTIRAIRTALKERSGKDWSVRGGRGTAYGWITISAPPRRLVDGDLSPEDAAELGSLLEIGKAAHCQGVDVPASLDYRREYVQRARGLKPNKLAEPYWD